MDEIVLVTDDEIRSAQRYLLEKVRQVVEPSGATSVAAALRDPDPGGVVALISGGNLDLAHLL